jgi:hypothetical protein
MGHAGPLKSRQHPADTPGHTREKEAPPVPRYRRVLTRLGWLAVLVMAVGAGWKTN